jgi:hypothetical protein
MRRYVTVFILSQIKPSHALPTDAILFSIILPSTPSSFKWVLLFVFSHRTPCERNSPIHPYVLYAPPSPHLVLDRTNAHRVIIFCGCFNLHKDSFAFLISLPHYNIKEDVPLCLWTLKKIFTVPLNTIRLFYRNQL